MNMGTASGVEDQVTGPKIAGPPAFTPAYSASINLQPFPQPPLPQILREPDFKELDDLEDYNKFADVLQVLKSLEIDESIGQNKNVKSKFKKIRILGVYRCFIFYIKRNQIRLSFAFLGRTTCILF